MTAEPTVIAKLAEWLKHSRDGGLHHVSIPCDRVDEILALWRAREVAGLPELKKEKEWVVENLVLLIRKLSTRINESSANDPLATLATEYVDNHERLLALHAAREAAPGADDLKRGPNELLTSASRNPAKNPFIERRWELRKTPVDGQAADVTLEGSLNAAVQAAARDLPDDYVISICVERGSAWVEVCGGERFEYLPDGAGMTLSEQISECIAKAKEHASPSNHDDVQDAAAGER